MNHGESNLTDIPMCPRERFNHYKKYHRLVLCNKKDWATLLHLVTLVTCYLLQIILLSNYLSKLLYSACREYLAENRLSIPSAPRWVRHSYLSKGLQLIPYTCGRRWWAHHARGGMVRHGTTVRPTRRALQMEPSPWEVVWSPSPPVSMVASFPLSSRGGMASSSSWAASTSGSPSSSPSVEVAVALPLFLGEALLALGASGGVGSSNPCMTGSSSWPGSRGSDRKAAKFANRYKAK